MPLLLKLVISFMLIGLGAYGGGMVTIPLIQHELVDSRHWLEFSEMARILVVSQMTPGPIAVNAATFTGFRLSGIPGAILATVAVIVPSIVILALLVPCIERFKNKWNLRDFMQGIKIGVLGLILFAVWSYGKAAIKGWLDLAIAAAAFLVLAVFEGKLHPVIVILACGVIGAIVF
ncbi:MAG: chromate transporter [Candidatus Auribacter fodinae]|jgi:chromate transporter|uniref:Chromate transporter n=1 Tax=Candidatus Auribacter fodinae TaxID=2093366 RepID=A0A3A4R6N7_9BACT|nr:MAG: chromate transporter [Candidatus Auribacter fodinae]